MANHMAGEVEVVALGRPLIFRLGVNEMLEAQNGLGLADKDDAFLAVFDEERLRNLKTVRAIAFYGLKRNQPEITEQEAGDVVVEVGLLKFGDIIREALRWALPEKDEGARDGAARPSPGPLSSSTRPERASHRPK
jgi:hypothetical protein